MSIKGFFRVVELKGLKKLCSPFLGWNTGTVMPRLFPVNVCLISSEEILNDADSTTFHDRLFPCLTSEARVNHRTFRDAESSLDA